MKSLRIDNRAEGPASMIGVVIAGLVAIIVGVMIWYKINSAIFAAGPGSMIGPRAALNATYLSSNTSANTIWTLFPIVAIVVVAGVILAVVMGFGRQQA